MDKISDIISDIIDFGAIIFIASGFVLLWIIGKIQKYRKMKKRKEWKKKKIEI